MQSSFNAPPAGSVNHITSRQLQSLNFFWAGCIIYFLAYCFQATTESSSLLIIGQLLQLIGLGLIFFKIFNLLSFKFDDSYLKVMFAFFYFWQFVIIMRGFKFDVESLKVSLFNPNFGIFSYLAPFILLFPRNLAFYKKLFDVIIIFGIFYLLFDVVFLNILLSPDRKSLISQGTMESFAGLLAIQSGFILLTYVYHSKRRQFFALCVMFATILLAVFRARRGLIFMCVSTLMCYFMTYLITTKKKILIIYSSVFMVVIVLLYMNSVYKQSEGGLFSFLIERGDEDTRSGVEDFMIADMSDTDWMIGKGIAGEYYCPNIDENDQTGYRSVIESGYLEMLLKGGLFNLVPYLLIALPAIFMGLFNSNNILSKAAGMWVLLSTIYIYPIVVTSFDLRNFLYWIGIGICYSRKIRSVPDNILKDYFQRPDEVSKKMFL